MKITLILFVTFFQIKADEAEPSVKLFNTSQQQRTINGTVLDDSGVPIIGANIMVVGTTNGSITDVDGKFSLSDVPNNALIKVTYIGYKEQTIDTQGKNTFNIVLSEDQQSLDEVVVVGYGVQKKVNLTGSVATVKYDQELENRPITDVSQALQGRVAGVWANQWSGNPGDDGATIRIRGYGTLSSGNNRNQDPDPLVLIDGIEGKISEVDPNSIESMTVLKDAASAAIYGSRAANGVILIETKKGQKDRLTLTYNGYVGMQKKARDLDIISNSADYMELWNEALTNTGGSPLFPDNVIQAFRTGNDPYKYPNTDFSKEIFRKSFTTQHTISVNTGSQRSSSYISLSYLKNEGILRNTESERYSLNMNNETTINKWLKIGGRARMQRRINEEPGGNQTTANNTSGIDRVLYMVMNGHPYASPYLQDGKTFGGSQAVYLDGPREGQPITDTRNPFPDLYNGKRTTYNNFFRGNVYGIATLMDGLSLSVNYSGQYTNNHRDSYNQANYTYREIGNEDTKDKSLDYITRRTNWRTINDSWYSTFFTNLNLYRTFNEIHEVTAMLGFQQEEQTSKYTMSRRSDPAKDGLIEVNSGTADIEGEGNTYKWRMLSYFGRASYAYRSKYLMEFNLRADGSSRFADGNRWGYFPSISGGWRIGEENFLKNTGIFDNLKLRASWGKLGNQNTGRRDNRDYFPYLTIITQDYERSYNYNNVLAPGAAVISLVDKDITWETTTTTDVGLDISVLKNRLNIEADYFYKVTSDILVTLPLPKTVGAINPPIENIGEVVNKGIELNVAWQDRVPAKNFSYKLAANFTYLKNEVTKFQGGKSPDQTFLIREGYSFRELYGYICEGVYQSDAEGAAHLHSNSYKPVAGDLKYKDLNGDGKIDNNDMTSMGNTIPKYTFGLNGSVSWKDFDLSFSFAGQGGYTLYYNNAWSQPLAVSGGPIYKRWYGRWTPENPSNSLPRITINNAWLRDYPSTFWTVDMLWLKLKNVQFGYSVPSSVAKKLSLQRLYVYVNASDLFTLVTKDYEGFDPEREGFNTGAYNYPVPKVFTLGLNITF